LFKDGRVLELALIIPTEAAKVRREVIALSAKRKQKITK
jgi:hypothetical protein